MDYDIVVVGAGPAGLSAAARAAWLATPGATYRARIVVLDAGSPPGGLSRWQPLVVNTPDVFFNKRELKALLTTLANHGVEIRQERVLALRPRADGSFDVETATTTYRSLAVIVATGCRLGHPGESRLFHRKRLIWFHSNAALDHIVGQLEHHPQVHTVCLCGAEGVAATRRYIGDRGALEILTYAEPPYSGPAAAGIEQARLTAIEVNKDEPQLRLRFERADGGCDEVNTHVMLVDFNAYEARATTTHILPEAVRKQANGYLDPERNMGAGIAGLFSAGDVTGAPFGVSKAIGEGVIAGFSAYDYVCVLRTGVKPNLFPFYPYEI